MYGKYKVFGVFYRCKVYILLGSFSFIIIVLFMIKVGNSMLNKLVCMLLFVCFFFFKKNNRYIIMVVIGGIIFLIKILF